MATPTQFETLAKMIEEIAGVEPTYDPKYDLLRLDPGKRLQVRIDRNNAPKEMVERFAYQMSENEFPPMVVSADDRMIDGNTRYEARRKREERFAPVLIVPLSWDKAKTDEEQKKLLLLGLYLNNRNGKPLTQEEQIEMIRDALAIGWTVPQIVYSVGINDKTVKSVRDTIQAEKRLGALGIPTDKIPPVVMKALGRESAIALDDESYRGLTELSRDAKLGVADIKTLSTSLGQASTEGLRKDLLTRERNANATRIADVARGSNGHPPKARSLRDRLTPIVDGNDPATAFVERNADFAEDHLRLLNGAIAFLTAIRDLQTAIEFPATGDRPAASAVLQ